VVCLALLVAGLVGWSRIRLRRHEPSEVFAGLVMGFFGMLLAVVVGSGVF
jgi:membrane-associated phospholipid phosphatase